MIVYQAGLSLFRYSLLHLVELQLVGLDQCFRFQRHHLYYITPSPAELIQHCCHLAVSMSPSMLMQCSPVAKQYLAISRCMTAPQADAHAGAACANKCIGVISYVQMQMRFVMRIRMRLTESVHVAIQNVSAHESDKYSKERRHYRRVFLKKDMAER